MEHDHRVLPVETAHEAPGSSLHTLSELREKCHTPIPGGDLGGRRGGGGGREGEGGGERERGGRERGRGGGRGGGRGREGEGREREREREMRRTRNSI